MKLASLKDGRDGHLVLVSRDLQFMYPAHRIAETLQQALDNWAEVAPALELLYLQLSENKIERQPFNVGACASPLPRAYQWADGSAYVNHVELVRKARGAEMPESFWHSPLMYQGGSDTFLGPYEDIQLPQCDGWGG
ncbi:MAG: fumarylacetoacetate (FAA) hydrolase [Lentisphaeria bacterium]|jgi:fumarylacetoacetate (FAA) hydrolase